MRTGGTERAQSVQVGVILLFGFLIVAVSSYQAFVVPQNNAEVEFTDYQGSTTDAVSLRNAMLSSAADGNVRGRTVDTGTRYPVRTFFVNPPPATGRVRTTERSNVSVSGITAAGDYPNVRQYLSAESNELTYTTRSVAFEPAYNEFDGAAPVVVENGVVYRDYDSPITSTAQTLVDGNRIRLVTVSGDVRAEGLSASVTVSPVSAHTRTVTVTGRSSSFNLTVPTGLSESTWEDLLSDQLDPDGSNPDRYVRAVTKPDGADYVNITMEGDQQYELQIARLELREESHGTREASPDARYLVSEVENRTRTNREGRVRLVVEARDRFNNPVSNSPVTFNASVGTFETRDGEALSEVGGNATVRTDEDGTAVVYFNATGDLGTVPVAAYLGRDSTVPSERRTRFRVFNSVLGGDGGGGSGERAGRSLVVLNGTEPVSGTDETITLNVTNTGTMAVNVTGYRLEYVSGIGRNGDLIASAEAITNVTFSRNGTARQVNGVARELRSPYVFGSDPYPLRPGTTDVTLRFDQELRGEEQNVQGIFLSLAIYFEGDVTVNFALQIIV